MMPLMDAALRSLLLALAVWIGLRLFRVRSVPAQKAAWIAVLVFSLLMPVLLPIAAHLPAATIVLPTFARHIGVEPTTHADSSAAASSPAASGFDATDQIETPFSKPSMDEGGDRSVLAPDSRIVPLRRSFSLLDAASLVYFCVAGMLLIRLLYGIAFTIRLWRVSEPAPLEAVHLADGVPVRCNRAVFSPVTLGSGVVLPADYDRWSDEKLRIVLAHERAHIRNGDFYLQALAGLYAALVWFSPLGWWLKRKLSDLGETMSDHSGLEEAPSGSSYAQILLEFAAAPRPTPIGVAMARSSNLSRRIERLLNQNTFRQAFAGGRRTLLAALLVPAVLLAATTLVRVQAAGTAQQQTSPAQALAVVAEPLIGQARPDDPPPDAAPAPAPQNSEGASPASADHIDPIHVAVPEIHVDVPAIHVNVMEKHIDIPAIHVNVPDTKVDVPGQHIDIPATKVDVPAQHIDIPATKVDIPAQHVDVPAIHIDVPANGTEDPAGGRSSYGPTGELHAMLSDLRQAMFPAGRRHAVIQSASSSGAEATFDRTLTFNGKLDLSVATGSGSIHISRGTANQIHIHGIVKASWDGDPAEVQRIAANPPIAQNGNIVCVGLRSGSESDCAGNGRESENHISISYEIEAPADAMLKASSGSGGIHDEGVGQSAKLNTGSGSIDATGLQGGFNAQTGSGSITAENAGEGDVRAQTGSGRIEIQGVHGALEAQTGSGGIKVTGTPSSAWKLRTGSGGVDLSTNNAPIDLDASTGSGSISTNQPAAERTKENRHHLHAQLNGGGTEVRIDTGSGSIHVE